jgi:hypothetical protein
MRRRLEFLPVGGWLQFRLLKKIFPVIPDSNVDGPWQGNIMVVIFQSVDRVGKEVVYLAASLPFAN